MRYFHLNLKDADQAQTEVWERQHDVQPTLFYVSAEGLDASVWTKDTNGEILFRLVLDYLRIPYEEGDEQQVQAKGFGI